MEPDQFIRTPAPRSRYLDLLAKVLTGQLAQDPPMDPWSYRDYREEVRRGGRDWPLTALTMIGERRLHNILDLVREIIATGVPGDLIETGVWRGGACIFMRAILATYGITDRRVWVADSFEGLPPPNPEVYPKDAGDLHHKYDQLRVSLEQVKSNFASLGLLDDRVVFLKGWFENTLPTAPTGSLALLRLDCDMYSSTEQVLYALYPRVSSGGFVVVDDWGAVPACRQAVEDYRFAHRIAAPIVDIDGMGVYWQV